MHRNAILFVAVLLMAISSAIGWAQTAPPAPSGGGNTPTQPTTPSVPTNPRPTVPNPNNFPSMEMNRPIYLRGKVVLDRGGELSEPVPIQRVCGSTAHREGYTDTSGNFSILVGDNSTFQDASKDASFT